jgi:hypothetical protein
MQASHAQDDHVRLPADPQGEGSEPVEGAEEPRASAAVAIAVDEPRGAADAAPLASPLPRRRRSASSLTAHPSAPVGRTHTLFANLDLILLVPGVALALALGAPAFGVLVGAGAWLLQRVVAVADRRAIVRAAEPGSRLGLNFIDAFARIWLLAGAIIVAGAAGSRPDGLAAAVVIFACYSVAFAVRIARGREAGPS